MFANRLRQARRRAGLTQAELARLVGTSQPTLSAYENGSKVPGEVVQRRLLRALDDRPSRLLDFYRDDVIAVCGRHGAHDVRVFGSVAVGEDTPDSDLDLLVRFGPTTSVFDHAALVDQLVELLGIDVDVVSEGGLRLPEDAHILRDARPV